MLDDINSILYKARDINISKGRKTKKERKQSRKEWFDEDLSKLKHELISLGKAVANDYSNMYLRGNFFSLKKSFKKACIRKRNTFRPFWTIWRDLKIEIQKSTGSNLTNWNQRVQTLMVVITYLRTDGLNITRIFWAPKNMVRLN